MELPDLFLSPMLANAEIEEYPVSVQALLPATVSRQTMPAWLAALDEAVLGRSSLGRLFNAANAIVVAQHSALGELYPSKYLFGYRSPDQDLLYELVRRREPAASTGGVELRHRLSDMKSEEYAIRTLYVKPVSATVAEVRSDPNGSPDVLSADAAGWFTFSIGQGEDHIAFRMPSSAEFRIEWADLNIVTLEERFTRLQEAGTDVLDALFRESVSGLGDRDKAALQSIICSKAAESSLAVPAIVTWIAAVRVGLKD